jgi:hypothetical protein
MTRYKAGLVFAATLLWPGCKAAQLSRDPRIEVVDVGAAIVAMDGTTANGIEVTYTIEFVPANATRAEVQYLRDGEVIRTFPAPMKQGTNKVTLPHGLPAVKPPSLLTLQVELPDGTLSEKAYTRIFDADDFVGRDARARARFTRLTPDLIEKKSSPQFVTLSGTGLAPMATWLTINGADVPVTIEGDNLKLTISPDLFTVPGFVRVEQRRDYMETPLDPRQSLVLAVADPSLPKPGGLTTVTIRSADSSVLGSNRRLTVRGDGLEQGMQVVIGRGTTPVEVFPTDVGEGSSLIASGGFDLPAGEYFVAVLSADKRSLSRLFPVSSPGLFGPTERSQYERDTFDSKPSRLEAQGDLAWNATSPQWLRLQGPKMRPGLKVRIGRDAETVTVDAEAETASTADSAVPVVRIPLPSSFLKRPVYDVKIQMYRK